MSHEITIRKNAKAEMAYVGEKPWHGLGQELREGASIDEWKVAAGMDWRVCRSRVRYGDGPAQRIFDERHVLFRSDSKAPLAVVSDQYKIVHPGEVLEFFRDLTENAGFHLNTAGTLFGGRRFWALARIAEDASIIGRDKVGGFLLLSSSCDGSMETEARLTTVRVVCNNTLSMARGAQANVSLTHRSAFNPNAIKDKLGIVRGSFKSFIETARALAEKPVASARAAEYFVDVLKPAAEKPEERDAVRESAAWQKMMALFSGAGKGALLPGAAGTAWGAVNAVTEYIDHWRRAASADHRMFNAMFGYGDGVKNRALELAEKL